MQKNLLESTTLFP